MTNSYNIKPTPFGQKYALLNHIKSGGMAAVWLGKMPVFGGIERLVAIKRILPHVAEDTEFISMFIDEAKITVQLSHPNICKIYELGQDLDARSYYIVMEYVHGRDLRALFDVCVQSATPAPIPVACYVMACCCDGLNYAHRRKDAQGNEMRIVHRDVSLQNILVSFDGDVKLIDFGIAKAVNKSTQTAVGTLKGKFSYMSPEQISGPPEKVDRRSDIFGIGICLYEMLTGKRLFSGKTDFSVLEKVRKAEVALPTTLNRDIPPALEKIVMKALARDVEERYQHASEVGDDLRRFLYGLEEKFDRRNLAEYMQTLFAKPYADEKVHLQECLATPAFVEPSVEQTDDHIPAVPEELAIPEDLTRRVDLMHLPDAAKAQPEEVPTEDGELSGLSEEAMAEVFATSPTPPPSDSGEGLILTPTPLSGVVNTLDERTRPPPLPKPPNASGITRSTRPKSSRLAPLSGEVALKGAEKQKASVLKKYLWLWVVSVLTLVAAVVVLVWPSPMGNILIEMPEELAGGKVRLFINDKEMLDKGGGRIQTWPRLFQVPAGKLRLSMSAEGYESLAIEMVVPKGQKYVRLSQSLQKQKTPPPAP